MSVREQRRALPSTETTSWPRRAIIPVAIVFFALQVIGTVIAIAKKLPYENSTGQGDPNNVAGDFLMGGGTALSAPLLMLVIFVALIGLGRLRNRWGTVALVGTMLLGAVATFFGAQEPIASRMLQASPFGLFEAIVVVMAGLGLLASAAIAVLSLLMVIGRLKKK